MIPHRNSKTDNPYIPGYDAHNPHSYIIYFDFTNIYGMAMTQPLPIPGFVGWIITRTMRWMYTHYVTTKKPVTFLKSEISATPTRPTPGLSLSY